MRPKSKAELTAEIETLQTRIHNLEPRLPPRGYDGRPASTRAGIQGSRGALPRCHRAFRLRTSPFYVSPAVQVVTGFPPQAFIGKTNREMGMPQDLAERWETALRQVFETGQEVCIEFEYPSPDGPRHYESRLFPERAQDGAIAAVCQHRAGRDGPEARRGGAARECGAVPLALGIQHGWHPADGS